MAVRQFLNGYLGRISALGQGITPLLRGDMIGWPVCHGAGVARRHATSRAIVPPVEVSMKDRPEFSRPLAVRRIGANGTEITVEATEAECRAVAARLRLPQIDMLRCRYHLREQGRGVVEAQGALAARFMQTCVVSLESFEDMIAGSFVVRFVPAEHFVESDLPDMDAVDEIPYEGQDIDLGEAVVEQFALELDPYPHAPDIDLPPGLVMDEDSAEEPLVRDEGAQRPHPFAALSRWNGGKA
ncbi:MAG: DUF177 domain-containing protein [Acetobacter sp.]|uniref:DUF177 domain-containing protein n=1 Tax=Acetobacter sp. TaxID=440 RepID=UPI003CFEDC5A